MKNIPNTLFMVLLICSCSTVPPSGKSGSNAPLPPQKPHESDFQIVVLDQILEEPMELDFFSDGRILFIERKGLIKLYNPNTNSTEIISQIPVQYAHVDESYEHKLEDGLLGVAIDPDYDNNNWVYLYYSPVGDEPKQYL